MEKNTKPNAVALRKTEELLREYPPDKFIPLLPTTTLVDSVGTLVRPTVELVSLDPDPKNGKDVYIDTRRPGVLVPTHVALMRFGSAAGVSWPKPLQEVVEWNKSGIHASVIFQATGVFSKADGTPISISAMKEIDTEVLEAEIRSDYERFGIWKYDKVQKRRIQTKDYTEKELDTAVRRDLLHIRGNLLQLAESKAQNRVIRKALGIGGYKPEAIKDKSFVVVRFDSNVNLDDPRQASAAMKRAEAAESALFGVPVAAGDTSPLPEWGSGSPPLGTLDAEAEVKTPADPLSDLDKPLTEEELQTDAEKKEELEKLGRVSELVDGLDTEGLKALLISLVKDSGYDTDADSERFIFRWREAASIEDERDRKESFSLIIYDLETAIRISNRGELKDGEVS